MKAVKQTMKYLSMAALVVMGAVVVSCSKKEIDQPNEETTEVVEPAAEDNIVVCTTNVSFDTDGTKALDEDGVKTFAPGEKIAVIYKNNSDQTVKAESDPLPDGDYGKTATFTVALTDPKSDAAVRIIYPAAMAASTVDTDTEVDADATINYAALNSQDGTLATLSSNLDLAVYDGNLVGTDLPADPAIHNKLAICLYTLKSSDGSSDITSSITGMTISDGTYNYSVSRSAAAGPIYVAIRPTSDATINYTATDGTYYFKKTVTGKTYVASQMYPLGLRMSDYGGIDLSTLNTDYVAQHGDVLTGELTRSCKISIADGATVTLKGVNITNLGKGCFYAGITCLGDATILLSGSNYVMGGMDDGSQYVGNGYGLWPGIFVPSGRTLTIDGTGSLDARTNGINEYTKYAPGIGGDWYNGCGNIIIQGGIVTATGGYNSAGIGGYSNNGGGYITITGSANVTATGGNGGAGIGSGESGSCGDITISTTGTVTATGGESGAGIGAGYNSPSQCGKILISGGTIVATGGDWAAGIGSGESGSCGDITISTTGTVTATGGAYGAGIGSGRYNQSQCGKILISGGTIVATGGDWAVGIGSGSDMSTCGDITIENTVTSVTATRGTDTNECIGRGAWSSCGTVKFGDQTMFNGSSWTTTPTDGVTYGGLSLAITTTTNTNDTWTLTPYVAPAVPTGAIDGLFTVSDDGGTTTKQVYFSQGNLQAVGTTSSSPSSGWTWQFAEHQYDYIGGRSDGGSETQTGNNYINGNGTLLANGTVDLFSWSTNATYYGIQDSDDPSDYRGTFQDWGKTIDPSGTTWRTLTMAEWVWVLGPWEDTDTPNPGTNCRTSSTVNGVENARYAKATVAGKAGLIIFPDSYTHPGDVTAPASVNTTGASYTANSYDATAWGKMEAAGAVFLPAAGSRFAGNNKFVQACEVLGFYWSSVLYDNDETAHNLIFQEYSVVPSGSSSINQGMSVRLVRNAN